MNPLCSSSSAEHLAWRVAGLIANLKPAEQKVEFCATHAHTCQHVSKSVTCRNIYLISRVQKFSAQVNTKCNTSHITFMTVSSMHTMWMISQNISFKLVTGTLRWEVELK